MSDPDSDRPPDSRAGPRTRDELEASLDELLQSALANGVEVNDVGIDLRHDAPELPDWEVYITLLRKPPTDDE